MATCSTRGVRADGAVGSSFAELVPLDGATGVAVEDPLRWVVGVGLRQSVRIRSIRYAAPVIEVEGNFDQRGVGDVDLAGRCV